MDNVINGYELFLVIQNKITTFNYTNEECYRWV